MMIQQSLPKFIKNTSVISAICSSLMTGLITMSQAGGPPPGTTKPPTQPSTEESTEVESETTEPTRRQPPAANQQEDNSEPPAGGGKPAEVESETTEPTRRQPPAANQQEDNSKPPAGDRKPAEVESETTEPTRRQPPTTESAPTPQSETTEPPPKFPEPAGRVTPVENLTTLRLINHTDAVISYQVIGGRHRTLGERSVVELSELPVPLTLTYQRSDGGLLLVHPRGISSGVLEVRFNATEDFDLDTKSLNITGRGGVFLN